MVIEMVDLPIKMEIFHSYVSLPEGSQYQPTVNPIHPWFALQVVTKPATAIVDDGAGAKPVSQLERAKNGRRWKPGEDVGKPWQTSQFLWFIMIFYDTGMNQNLSLMGSLILVYLASYLSHSFFGQNHLEKAW